ncbi:MAG: pre-peptidase C-terminal domain-containing protein, partial [Myxococcota bacterium]|nr:pre-peptidase C-terminal domain-containing protein [Myxococcota bacterium]
SSYNNIDVDISLAELPLPTFFENSSTAEASPDSGADTDAVNEVILALGPCEDGMRCIDIEFTSHGMCMPESLTVENLNQLDRCTECGECEGPYFCSSGGIEGYCGRICDASYIDDSSNLPGDPSCEVSFLADGWCDPSNNNEMCGWDMGDCCESTCIDAAFECGTQHPFDCQDPNAEDFGSSGNQGTNDTGPCHWNTVGDGICQTINNNLDCSWDEGDCCESTCMNSASPCGSDGYSCEDPNASENGGSLYGVPDMYEPNNTLEHATELTTDLPQTHSLHGSDRDYLTFMLEEPANVLLTLSSPAAMPSWNILDSDGTQVSTFDSWSSNEVQLEVRPLDAGQYYIEFSHWEWSGLPSYTVTLTLSAPSSPPPTEVTAEVSVDQSVHVSWQASPSLDRYRVYWGSYPHNPITDPASGEVTLAPGETTESNYTIVGLTPGSYYDIWVTGLDSAGIETAPSDAVSVQIPIVQDPHEPDDTPDLAGLITLGETKTHSIHAGSDDDYTRFEIEEPTSVRIRTGGDADTVLTLFDSSQTQIAFNDDFGGLTSLIDAPQLAPGTYFILVQSYGQYSPIASYTLTLEWIDPSEGPVDPSLLPDGYCSDGTFCVPPFPEQISNLNGTCGFGMATQPEFCVSDSVCSADQSCMQFPDGFGFCVTACDSTVSIVACEDANGSPYQLADGFCDAINNHDACGYDGGDCCQSTCRSPNCLQTIMKCIDPQAP